MIKIFILNIVVSIIHFVSVETTNQWFYMMIKTGNAYGVFSSDTIRAAPVCPNHIIPDSLNNYKIKFFGYSLEIYKSKILNYQFLNFRIVANDYTARFKYYESGNSPPIDEFAY